MTGTPIDTGAEAPALGAPETPAPDAVQTWRKTARRALLDRRQNLDRDTRTAVRDAIAHRLRHDVPALAAHHTVGFYWPIRGEPDLRALVRELIAGGAEAALPVVTAKRAPVEFWRWTPRMRMQTGPDGIPRPPERAPVRPTALLIPFVGFDAAGYRLGYGAGYYDRTLAALDPKPLCVGVGPELGRLSTIYPQPHDIPLDVIVTETATHDHRP